MILILVIILIEILVIWFMIWDNISWQRKVLKELWAEPKPKKHKLKRGQKVIFEEEELKYNPFEELASAYTNTEQRGN